ncbi:hypothetical protein PMAYCL1PPCAC_08651, partial [Pristionchus mayeri]
SVRYFQKVKVMGNHISDMSKESATFYLTDKPKLKSVHFEDDSSEHLPILTGSLTWNMRLLTAEAENKRLKYELVKMRAKAEASNEEKRRLKVELAKIRAESMEREQSRNHRWVVRGFIK